MDSGRPVGPSGNKVMTQSRSTFAPLDLVGLARREAQYRTVHAQVEL